MANKLFICPTRGRAQANGYVYNSSLSGRALGDFQQTDREYVTADGNDRSSVSVDETAPYSYDALTENPSGNTYYTLQDVSPRHTGKFIASFLDGHVEMTDIRPPVDIKWTVDPTYATAVYNGYGADDYHTGSSIITQDDTAVTGWVRLGYSAHTLRDGRVSFKLDSSADVVIGLMQTSPVSHTAMNVSILGNRGTLKVIEGGIEQMLAGAKNYTKDDVLTIERKGKKITYWKNNVMVRLSDLPSDFTAEPQKVYVYSNSPSKSVVTNAMYTGAIP